MPQATNQRERPRFRFVLAWFVLLTAVGLTLYSWSTGGIVHDLLRQDTDAVWKIERLKEFFASFGALAPLVYFLFVTVEVIVAPIPGLMLYAPGGLIFGAALGGAIALAGNVAGAGIACTIARSINPVWLERFFEPEKMEAAQRALERRGSWLIFLLRLNPLTSSDIVSYAAGFTRIPVSKVMFATLLGMAPLCFAQAWLAENLLTAFPALIYPLLAACVAYVVLIVFVIRRLSTT
ncbi:MAG: VTT domain-containing protein [Pirellulales bacterium]|nr:VTT domain-containing protein [Pirellulales bacterium]